MNSNYLILKRVRPAPGTLFLFMPTLQANLQLIRILTDRLERISADSVWAHRASGIRGALLRILDSEQNENTLDKNVIERATNMAHYILTQAAKEK